jgi:outer membrane receptor protein involved in Fe transport
MTKNARRNKADDYIRREKAFLPAIFVLLLATALPGLIFGQGATGAINGTVTDPTGAVVPAARVVLHNIATGGERSADTNLAGVYVFPDVLPGKYTLRVTKPGFKTATENPFTLSVNQTSTHNFTLSLGASTQEVTVSALAIHLEASTAELGTAINQSEVNNLPLNGRNFTQLLDLTPGVSPISTGQNAGGGGGFTGQAIGSFTFPSVGGQSNRSNMFLVDGFTNYNFTGGYAVAPIIDQIEEFKVQTHSNAAYGGSLGGIVNVVTRGGTSQYHGDVWEFLRNNALDARNTFVPTTTPYKQNQFGGVFGGPLLPKRFRSGEPKTFFFIGYEGFRSSRAAESLDNLVTPQMFAGDLSSISEQVYNPFSTRPDPNIPGQFIRDPFMCDSAGNPLPVSSTGTQASGTPCNQIPPSLINRPLVAYLQAFYKGAAITNTGISGVNFINRVPTLIPQDTATIRFDHQFNESTSGWVRYTGFTEPITSGTSLPSMVNANYNHGYQAGGAITHVFSGGSKVATFRFGRTSAQANVLTKVAPGMPATLGSNYFTSAYQITSPFFMPVGIVIPGFTGVPEGHFQGNHMADTYEWAGDFTWVHGRHTIQFGGDINTNDGAQPIYFVTQGYSSFNTANPENANGTGSALASFLLGIPSDSNRRSEFIGSPGGWVDGFYAQDQWMATKKLHVNIGLRYDVTLWPIQSGPPGSGNEYTGDTDLDTGQYILAGKTTPPPACSATVQAPCIPGGTLPAHVIPNQLGNGGIVHNPYDNWQPRLGLTYRLPHTTVLRASIGKVFDNWAAVQQLGTNWQGAWPSVAFVLANNLNNPTATNPTPTIPASDPLSLGNGVYPAPTPFNQVNWFIDPYFKNAYSVQWNFGVQHQFGNNTILEADYVGSRDSRTDSGAYRNVAVTPGPGNPQDRAPFPYITPTFFDKSVGQASYNAFQFSLRHNVSHGLTYLVSYTYSKAENLGCDGFFGSEGCSVQNPYKLSADWSVAGYDVTHLLSASWVYNLPFGSGQRYRISNHLVNALIGDWTFNGIATFRSGVPYNVNASGDIPNTGNVVERANQIGPAFMPNPTAAQYLNPASFVAPPPFTFGTEGRNNLRSPFVSDMDLSIFRNFAFTEDKYLQFRADFFNAPNWQALGTPDNTVGDPHFGAVFGTAQTERQIQFALKFYF